MRKKVLTIVLALGALLAYSACSSINDVRGTVKADAPANEVTAGEMSVEAETEATAEVTEPFSLGHNANNTYENSFLGIGCKFDEAWTFSSDEDIKSNLLTASENLQDGATDVIDNAMSNGNFIVDMMVVNESTESNVSVGIIKSGKTTEEEYIDLMVDTISSTMESAYGLTNIKVEKTTINLAGKPHFATKMTATMGNGVEVSQIQVAYQKGSYMTCITASAFGDETADELLTAFYALD